MRRMLETRPEMAEALLDPINLQRAMRAAMDPAYKAELMQSSDQAMQRLMSHEGGEAALQRFWRDSMGPRYADEADAARGTDETIGAAPSTHEEALREAADARRHAEEDRTGPVRATALPNPWARPSAPPAGMGMGMGMGGMGGMGGFNPFAGFGGGGGAAPSAAMGAWGAGTGGPTGGAAASTGEILLHCIALHCSMGCKGTQLVATYAIPPAGALQYDTGCRIPTLFPRSHCERSSLNAPQSCSPVFMIIALPLDSPHPSPPSQLSQQEHLQPEHPIPLLR